MVKRLKEKHLITFENSNEWESLPQALNININNSQYSQSVEDRAFFTHENVAYAFNIKGITISLEGGLKGYWRSMNSRSPVGRTFWMSTGEWKTTREANSFARTNRTVPDCVSSPPEKVQWR